MGSQDSWNPQMITFPDRGEDTSPQPVPVQPRQPRNLQGLLRFAMEATKAEDAPGISQLGPIDEERRRFLEEAFKSLTVNVVQLLQASITLLSDQQRIVMVEEDDPVPDDLLAAFNNLLEYVDDIDIAKDFFKMGGYSVFPVCFGSASPELRAHAYTVLAELCQNNEYCQQRTLNSGLLNVLFNLMQTETGNALSKCLYAISCTCRGYPEAQLAVVRAGACGWLAAAAGGVRGAARTRAAFFIRTLCHTCESALLQFVELNIVSVICEQLSHGRDEATEHFLNILECITRSPDSPTSASTPGGSPQSKAASQAANPALGLRHTITELLSDPDLLHEEKTICTELSKRLFPKECSEGRGSLDDEPDR